MSRTLLRRQLAANRHVVTAITTNLGYSRSRVWTVMQPSQRDVAATARAISSRIFAPSSSFPISRRGRVRAPATGSPRRRRPRVRRRRPPPPSGRHARTCCKRRSESSLTFETPWLPAQKTAVHQYSLCRVIDTRSKASLRVVKSVAASMPWTHVWTLAFRRTDDVNRTPRITGVSAGLRLAPNSKSASRRAPVA